MSVDTVTIEAKKFFDFLDEDIKNLIPWHTGKIRTPLAKQWRNNYEWRKKPVIRLIMADAQLLKPIKIH